MSHPGHIVLFCGPTDGVNWVVAIAYQTINSQRDRGHEDPRELTTTDIVRKRLNPDRKQRLGAARRAQRTEGGGGEGGDRATRVVMLDIAGENESNQAPQEGGERRVAWGNKETRTRWACDGTRAGFVGGREGAARGDEAWANECKHPGDQEASKQANKTTRQQTHNPISQPPSRRATPIVQPPNSDQHGRGGGGEGGVTHRPPTRTPKSGITSWRPPRL